MKTLKILSAIAVFFFALTMQAQTAEEIVDNFIETIGGTEAWSEVKSMKVIGVGRQQGVDYPFVATMMDDGRTVIDVDLQGTSFIVEAFDGESAWSMNFQTQKAEAFDSEFSLNYKNEAKDQLPSAFFNYKEKGYQIELVGKETWEGTEVYKIKLIKKPVMVDGKEEENIDMYFFDTENFVPIAMETIVKFGPAKGINATTVMSDYQEVDGLIMPFSVIEKLNGNVSLEMLYKTIEFNSKVDETIFSMPKE
ncbi:MAG: outer membrane lipoprotein-sorting protein [Bacteroidia bacterium]|nr:outer membrane lipoprotein-sorting protein [Bacteroidia bacterium]NND25447.1 outer membrane lipoprotein-sorting protein [Flavobacteriaceae bacterium]MBT8278943.1 outer membrane lipoprotein-sorting protein [Bacteroidia bacterium]NNK60617.1 outer membrane lipoprotein-sorting protein [Flavobacteriaceae bacterium]NNL32167.1 outer membrane lipoprotein-sorting protein [Flavobacteriaceae bacterium]